MVLIYLTFVFSVLAFADGNIGHFQIAAEYIPIFQTLLVTVYGAYFVGRSWEKSRKIMNNKQIKNNGTIWKSTRLWYRSGCNNS